MKKLFFIPLMLIAFSCNKTGENNSKDVDSTKIIDSINAVRMKYNDSIRALNNKNNYSDLSGKHKLTFVSDDGVSLTGTVNFTKIMSDGYEVKGNAKSGKKSSSLTEKLIEYRQNTLISTEKLHKPSMVKRNLRATAIHSEMKEKEISSDFSRK